MMKRRSHLCRLVNCCIKARLARRMERAFPGNALNGMGSACLCCYISWKPTKEKMLLSRLAIPLLLLSGLSVSLTSCPAQTVARSQTRATRPAPSASRTDPRVSALLHRLRTAALRTKTMTADFVYTGTSVKSQQMVTGSFRVMRPNFARVQFSYMTHPAFPNLVASDGKTSITFTPSSFLPNRTFAAAPFDSLLGARQASGLAAGGGTYTTQPAEATGANLHLWDGIPFGAFFDPERAIRQYGYVGNMNELKYEGTQKIDGVVYEVLSHHVTGGNIAGGENSSFEQHLYIGPDNLIHEYVLEFNSVGRHGVQVMRLSNIKTNVPLTVADFAFSPPTQQTASAPSDAVRQF